MFPLYDENPTKTFPFITILLIIANIAIFIWEATMGSAELGKIIAVYGFIPRKLYSAFKASDFFNPLWISVFTSMFLHGGLLHIGGNMLYLWIFGNNIEDLLGHFKFLLFYILAGIAGVIGQVVSSPSSTVPGIGASGAIAGVLGAYLLYYPGVRVVTAIPIFFFIQFIRLPAIIVIGFWIVIQLMSGFAALADAGQQFSGGVAWFAHIGGFIVGMILVLLFPKSRRHKNR